ncbi:hypothetical protein F4802DRAFT_619395 [Xylaria palmicola]|nr:hypothetical protein F4802DRAFT_619395 [Xylaria palmicola]
MPSKTGNTSRSLADAINVATRSVHTKLNKLVVSRLRLVVPPHAHDASQYVIGLLHIAPIYTTFESLWKEALELPGAHTSNKKAPTASTGNTEGQLRSNDDSSETRRQVVADARIKSLLASLYFKGLQRSEALREDLISLTCWSGRTLAEQLNDAEESPALAEFLAHTRGAVARSPHVLLAYAWVLYMALFSGGRIIRASLEGIDPAFWVPASARQQPTPVISARTPARSAEEAAQQQQQQPLGFFRFDTPEGGEDLKLEFKGRLLAAEDALTGAERADVVEEARRIFDHMIRLVEELDDICGTAGVEASLLGLRSRDSVVVETERRRHLAETSRRVGGGMGGTTTTTTTRNGIKEGREGHVKFG